MARCTCCNAAQVSKADNPFLSAIFNRAKTVIDVRFSTRAPPFLANSRHLPMSRTIIYISPQPIYHS